MAELYVKDGINQARFVLVARKPARATFPEVRTRSNSNKTKQGRSLTGDLLLKVA
jgi:hypothetical protein